MAEAITPKRIRDAMEAVPGLTLPTSLTDSMLREIIRGKTAHVMAKRGVEVLPDAGTDTRDLVDDAVRNLCILDVKRMLRPDEGDYLRALSEEQRLIERGLDIVETSSPDSGYRFDVVGGVD